ncbi:Sperm-associated antigen 17 [Cichlidogyrus casuarinus]|uniref:Sperm-associated antigen 17 n=1 Tax=Cichlidogyrus casuarinus TaxID=1844966 RepID=A0ABD2QE54_9PLAT
MFAEIVLFGQELEKMGVIRKVEDPLKLYSDEDLKEMEYKLFLRGHPLLQKLMRCFERSDNEASLLTAMTHYQKLERFALKIGLESCAFAYYLKQLVFEAIPGMATKQGGYLNQDSMISIISSILPYDDPFVAYPKLANLMQAKENAKMGILDKIKVTKQSPSGNLTDYRQEIAAVRFWLAEHVEEAEETEKSGINDEEMEKIKNATMSDKASEFSKLLGHLQTIQRRSIDEWNVEEQLDDTTLYSRLVEAFYKLPFVDIYQSKHLPEVFVHMQNPFDSLHRSNFNSWNNWLHVKDLGFRAYLQLVSAHISDWTLEQEAQYQAQRLRQELEKDLAQEQEPETNATSKGKASKSKSSKSTSRQSSASRDLFGEPEDFFYPGSLKAQSLQKEKSISTQSTGSDKEAKRKTSRSQSPRKKSESKKPRWEEVAKDTKLQVSLLGQECVVTVHLEVAQNWGEGREAEPQPNVLDRELTNSTENSLDKDEEPMKKTINLEATKFSSVSVTFDNAWQLSTSHYGLYGTTDLRNQLASLSVAPSPIQTEQSVTPLPGKTERKKSRSPKSGKKSSSSVKGASKAKKDEPSVPQTPVTNVDEDRAKSVQKKKQELAQSIRRTRDSLFLTTPQGLQITTINCPTMAGIFGKLFKIKNFVQTANGFERTDKEDTDLTSEQHFLQIKQLIRSRRDAHENTLKNEVETVRFVHPRGAIISLLKLRKKYGGKTAIRAQFADGTVVEQGTKNYLEALINSPVLTFSLEQMVVAHGKREQAAAEEIERNSQTPVVEQESIQRLVHGDPETVSYLVTLADGSAFWVKDLSQMCEVALFRLLEEKGELASSSLAEAFSMDLCTAEAASQEARLAFDPSSKRALLVRNGDNFKMVKKATVADTLKDFVSCFANLSSVVTQFQDGTRFSRFILLRNSEKAAAADKGDGLLEAADIIQSESNIENAKNGADEQLETSFVRIEHKGHPCILANQATSEFEIKILGSKGRSAVIITRPSGTSFLQTSSGEQISFSANGTISYQNAAFAVPQQVVQAGEESTEAFNSQPTYFLRHARYEPKSQSSGSPLVASVDDMAHICTSLHSSILNVIDTMGNLYSVDCQACCNVLLRVPQSAHEQEQVEEPDTRLVDQHCPRLFRINCQNAAKIFGFEMLRWRDWAALVDGSRLTTDSSVQFRAFADGDEKETCYPIRFGVLSYLDDCAGDSSDPIIHEVSSCDNSARRHSALVKRMNLIEMTNSWPIVRAEL